MRSNVIARAGGSNENTVIASEIGETGSKCEQPHLYRSAEARKSPSVASKRSSSVKCERQRKGIYGIINFLFLALNAGKVMRRKT